MRQIFERQHKGMGACSTVAERLHSFVELVREGQARQGELPPSRFLQRNAHVFDKMFDEESGIEIAREYSWREILQRPAGRGAAANQNPACDLAAAPPCSRITDSRTRRSSCRR